jgi:hypothetical protein
MSFYGPYVLKAIRDRLVADATLVALLTDPYVVIDEAEQAQQPPYVVLEWITATPDEGFSLRRHNLFIDVHTYVATQNDTDYLTTCTSIHNRVLGDWDEQATRVPTYGLDRWKMTLAAGAGTWTCGTMVMLEYRKVPNPEEGFVQWSFSFQVDAQKGIG